MGFSSNAITSIRNNRSLQRSTKSYVRTKGRSTMPKGYHNKNDKSPSFASLKSSMHMKEIRVFLVFGIFCVGLGLLLTMWIL